MPDTNDQLLRDREPFLKAWDEFVIADAGNSARVAKQYEQSVVGVVPDDFTPGDSSHPAMTADQVIAANEAAAKKGKTA